MSDEINPFLESANASSKEIGAFSEELNAFFARIKDDQALQERLYVTNEISDVASIAKDMGFKITASDILRAQAGRVLSLPLEQQEVLARGGKPQSGAQWGRDGGKGYLDSAGYWLIAFICWGYTHSSFEQQLGPLLAKIKTDKGVQAELLNAKTYNDVALMMNEHGYEVSGITLLLHQAEQILKLDREKAEKVACGQKDHFLS